MSVESQRVERWKQQALGEITYQKELYEALVEQKVTRYSQAPDDLPGELLVTKDGVEHKCRMCLEYDNAKQDQWPWFVRYRDVETNDIILESGSTCWDRAIGNMMNYIERNWRSREEIKLLDGSWPHVFMIGSLHDVHEYSQIDRFYKLLPYKTYDSTNNEGKHIKMIDYYSCPYCGSKNYGVSEHYCSSPESWEALAGREGNIYKCPDCGYRDDVCYRMS